MSTFTDTRRVCKRLPATAILVSLKVRELHAGQALGKFLSVKRQEFPLKLWQLLVPVRFCTHLSVVSWQTKGLRLELRWTEPFERSGFGWNQCGGHWVLRDSGHWILWPSPRKWQLLSRYPGLKAHLSDTIIFPAHRFHQVFSMLPGAQKSRFREPFGEVWALGLRSLGRPPSWWNVMPVVGLNVQQIWGRSFLLHKDDGHV